MQFSFSEVTMLGTNENNPPRLEVQVRVISHFSWRYPIQVLYRESAATGSFIYCYLSIPRHIPQYDVVCSYAACYCSDNNKRNGDTIKTIKNWIVVVLVFWGIFQLLFYVLRQWIFAYLTLPSPYENMIQMICLVVIILLSIIFAVLLVRGNSKH